MEIDGEETVVLDEGRRALRESIEQTFVKEFESTWINDLMRFDTMAKEADVQVERRRTEQARKGKKKKRPLSSA